MVSEEVVVEVTEEVVEVVEAVVEIEEDSKKDIDLFFLLIFEYWLFKILFINLKSVFIYNLIKSYLHHLFNIFDNLLTL